MVVGIILVINSYVWGVLVIRPYFSVDENQRSMVHDLRKRIDFIDSTNSLRNTSHLLLDVLDADAKRMEDATHKLDWHARTEAALIIPYVLSVAIYFVSRRKIKSNTWVCQQQRPPKEPRPVLRWKRGQYEVMFLSCPDLFSSFCGIRHSDPNSSINAHNSYLIIHRFPLPCWIGVGIQIHQSAIRPRTNIYGS